MRCPHCGEPVFSNNGVFSFGDLVLDPVAHEVWRGDNQIDVTHTEYRLLMFFAQHPGQVLTYSQFYEYIWGCDLAATSNRLRVSVGILRRKLGEPWLLHTVRSVGYVLRTP